MTAGGAAGSTTGTGTIVGELISATGITGDGATATVSIAAGGWTIGVGIGSLLVNTVAGRGTAVASGAAVLTAALKL
jgi:hypothetical protein